MGDEQGFDPTERGWMLVRYLSSLTGRRRTIAKAIFLTPVALVLVAVVLTAVL